MAFPNQLVQTGLGSVDWTGGTAPLGGVHTGTATIAMQDGTTFIVGSNRAEVLRKLDFHAIAQTDPVWVAFDTPSSPAVPVVLNANNVSTVT